MSHTVSLLLLAVLGRILLVQRVRVLIGVDDGARVSQESRLRLAHLLRVLTSSSVSRCIILLMELPLLLLKELLLLRRLAVGGAARVQVSTALI